MKKSIITLFLIFGISVLTLGQENNSIPLIEVQGNASRKIAPDQASFNIYLSEKAINVSTATSVLNTKTENLANALKKAKIKDYKLIADNFSVNINRIQKGNNWIDSGYVARQNLQIITTSQTDELQKIVEAIQSAGDMVFNLQFEVSQDQQKAIEKTLITEALLDAQNQAQLIAETLGIRTIRVHHVSFEGGLMPVAKFRVTAESTDAPLLKPDGQEITKRVFVKYTY
ncbi:MAG: SIMPL domain-containing protein [Algoriphagus sp.]|uniref:SIMPL domain-containing protein n=1 Tax=Algoriphagus sp. TaxID=1872435 RepID=UPI0017DCA938|nr:SIMPL domain-containing protein [Algoriphagus sp.]NVJ86041.1 SIMPL domain-containing protein [Algoriphagus sp.]